MLVWKQSSALSKVMTDLIDLVLVAVARPSRTYLCGSGPDAVETTDQITLSVVNILMVGDIYYRATMDEYLGKKRKYNNHIEKWDEKNVKGYYLVLQHCLKELKAELLNQDSWNTEDEARGVIAILILIRDLSFNKTDRKRSILATVETYADLYLGSQRLDQSTDEFYNTFTAQVDTVNANRGSAWFHNGVYNKHRLDLWDRYLVTADSLAAMSPAEKTAL